MTDTEPRRAAASEAPFSIQVNGSKGATYTVRRDPGQRWTCTCPAFAHRRAGVVDCKHIRQLGGSNAAPTPCTACGYVECRCAWTATQHDAETARLFARCEEIA